MEEKQEKEKGNFWLTVASFIVNKRKAIEILLFGNDLQCSFY